MGGWQMVPTGCGQVPGKVFPGMLVTPKIDGLP